MALLLLVVVPILELYVMVQVAQAWGFWNMLGLLVLIGLVGGWMVKRQGLRVWRRANAQLARGEAPTREVSHGLFLLLAGALLLFPGFVTDAVAVLLLLPPVRSGLSHWLVGRGPGRGHIIRVRYTGPIVDTTGREERRGPGELGRPGPG